MRLPDFLVIGAMKAGTTSLCWDLANHPGIFIPTVKEPHTLCIDDVTTERGKEKYARLFSNVAPGQLCGEGSTGYTKLPVIKNIPERARKVLGKDLKVIYIIREPVARALSHHYHLCRAGNSWTFEEALKEDQLVTTCSKYGMQLAPWVDTFGLSNAHVIRFEDYVEDKDAVIGQLLNFLNVATKANDTDESRVMNTGEGQRVPPDWLRDSTLFRKWTRFKRGQLYKRAIRPYLPDSLLGRAKKLVFNPPPERPALPPISVIRDYIEQLREDQELLCSLIKASKPIWNLDEVLDYYENTAG